MGAPPSPPAAARDTPLAQTLRFSKETVINHRRLDLVVPVPPTPSSRAAAVGATVACAGGRGAWPVPGPHRTRWPWRQEGLNAAVTVTAGRRGVSAPGPRGLCGVSLARPEHAERPRSRDLAAWGVPAGRFPSDDPGNCKIDGSFRLP